MSSRELNLMIDVNYQNRVVDTLHLVKLMAGSKSHLKRLCRRLMSGSAMTSLRNGPLKSRSCLLSSLEYQLHKLDVGAFSTSTAKPNDMNIPCMDELY